MNLHGGLQKSLDKESFCQMWKIQRTLPKYFTISCKDILIHYLLIGVLRRHRVRNALQTAVLYILLFPVIVREGNNIR